ncbi:MAG: hypothetical protein K5945_00930 [Bacteroidaceae bacterium]|nr:hypothetical protein [Bacteroidaceae bacterium]
MIDVIDVFNILEFFIERRQKLKSRLSRRHRKKLPRGLGGAFTSPTHLLPFAMNKPLEKLPPQLLFGIPHAIKLKGEPFIK